MNSEKRKYAENFDFKVMQYLDHESSETNKGGYRYVTYHSLTNPHFSYTSVYLATIMRLPWNINLTLQTTKDNKKEDGGNSIKNANLRINVEYNAKDDYLIVTGDIKPSLTDDIDAYDILYKNDKKWMINASLMIGNSYLNNSCQKIDDPYFTKCDYYTRSDIKNIEGVNLYYYESKNVIFWFEEKKIDTIYTFKGITFKIKLIDDKLNNREISQVKL
jgi:hypothetical protein